MKDWKGSEYFGEKSENFLKIHRIFGMAPKPITKQLRYNITLAVDTYVFAVTPSFTKLFITGVISISIRMVVVESIIDLQSHFDIVTLPFMWKRGTQQRDQLQQSKLSLHRVLSENKWKYQRFKISYQKKVTSSSSSLSQSYL